MARRSPRIALFVLAAGVVAAVAACAPYTGPDVTVHTTVLPLSGPCPEAGGAEFPGEIQKLRLTVTAADMKTPVEAEGDLGQLTAEQVPAGTNRVVGLFGLVNGAPVWRGTAAGVEVKPNEPTAVDVLLGRIADVTCARNADEARAFATATPLADGRILVVGGAKTSEDASATCGTGCRRLTGTTSAAVYNPRNGLFETAGAMQSARLFHTATLLDDGRVVIAGGTAEALVRKVDATHPFPIEPTQPVAAVEVFDPKTKSFSSGGDDPAGGRVFAAAVRQKDGSALITGGIPDTGAPNDLSNALASTTVCSGAPIRCVAGPPMRARRAGHTAFRIDNGASSRVMLWGGSVETGSIDGVDGFQLEALNSGQAQFALVNVAAMSSARNVFFAGVAQYVSFRVVSAGGVVRAGDGTFRLATVDVGGNSAGAVYVYDASFDVAGGIAVGPQGGTPMHLQAPRFFGAAAALPGNKRAVLAGGYTDLDFTPSDQLEVYDEASLVALPIPVGGVARALRSARGGLVAAAVGDGNVAFFGGESPNGGNRAPQKTAEIFADPQTPPGVAP